MTFSYTNKQGKTYYLHGNGRLFWFASAKGKNALEKKPDGYVVVEMPQTGMPVLKKAG